MPFHFNSTGLQSGAVILPGNWGRIIKRAAFAHGGFSREIAWEEVRQKQFSDLPSRLEAAYFFLDEIEARFYGNKDFSSQCTMLLYEVDLVEPNAKQHTADWGLIPPPAPNYDTDIIRAYWQGAFAFTGLGGVRRRETLAVTPLKILRRLDF